MQEHDPQDMSYDELLFSTKKHALCHECSNYEGIVRQLKTEVATLKSQLSISSATITKLRDDLRSKDFMIHE